MAIENLIKMAEQVSRLGDQDLAALTQDEGIQAILAATELKDRERVRSNVPITQGDQPTVIDNLINRALGQNQQASNPNMMNPDMMNPNTMDPNTMDPNMMDPNMMANMPAQPPMMPQGMQSNVDPRMLAQQPPMARMGGLLRRFASGRSLDETNNTFQSDYVEAMGFDPNTIGGSQYNEIISPEFQANLFGLNDNNISNELSEAKKDLRRYKNKNLLLNSPARKLSEEINLREKNILDIAGEEKEQAEAGAILQNLFNQGLITNNPSYIDIAKEAKGDNVKILELIRIAEGSKIDEDTTASLGANGQNIIDVGAGSGGAGTGDGASGQGDDAPIVTPLTTSGGVTIANAVAGSRAGDSKTIIKNAQTDANITNFAETKGTTLSGFAGDTRIRTDLDKAIIAKDKIDNNTLLSYQKDLDDAETALNKISETDFPSRDEIISKNKQQIKLGMAQAFFNAAGSGKPSFMEAMGESLGAASGVMQKGTAKEQKDLMQLAIADYNRAAKKYDIADKRRSALSAQITTKLANRQTREDKLTDQRFKLQERIDKKDEKIADMITAKVDAKEATRRWEAEQSIDVNKNFQAFFEDLRSDQFANTTMNSQEMEGYAAIQMGNVAMKYGSRPQTVALKGIERFTNEIPKIAKRLRSKDPSLSNQASIEAAKKEYRDFLIGGEELGSAAIFDHFDPIITKYQEDLIKFPNSKAANLAYMKDEFSWLPTAYYDED
tara:strand:- start:5187 stop:7358 length:2172 start_codon:yes stop_codon:yes gene_type:complete